MSTKPMIRVFVADNKRLNCEGLRRLIESVEGFSYVGEALVVDKVIPEILRTKPHVILLDVKWGASQHAGLKLLEQIHKHRIPGKVVLHTEYPYTLKEQNHRLGRADAIVFNIWDRDNLDRQIRTLFSESPNTPQHELVVLGKVIGLFSAYFIILLIGLAVASLYLGPTITSTIVSVGIVLFLILVGCTFFYLRRLNKEDFTNFLINIRKNFLF